MYKILTNLIKKRFYTTREEAIAKVDTVFAMGKITSDQYSDLMMLIDEYYPEIPEPNEETESEA